MIQAMHFSKMNFLRILVFICGAFILVGCNLTLAADITPPPGYKPATEQSVEPSVTTGPLFPLLSPNPVKGAAIYQEKCAPCHGTSGLGDGQQGLQLPNPVPAIGSAQLAREASPAEWYRIVTEGNLDRFMPPFESLSDRQRWDVVAYVWSLSNSKEIIEKGRDLYQSNCANCHGNVGKGDGPDGSEIMPDFSRQELMAGKSDEEIFASISNGVSPGMPSFTEKLTENERWSIAAYIRSLSLITGESIANEQADATPGAATVETPVDQDDSLSSSFEEQLGVGNINGNVVNGTSGSLPIGLEVQLHGFDHNSIVVTDTVPINEDGTYLFEGIEMPEGRIFLTSVEFEDVTYASEAVAVENEQSEIDLPIQVYEHTTDHSALKVDRLHYFFEPIDEENVRVVELFIISNPSGKTLISPAANQPVLKFQIPPEAENLQFQDGEAGQRFIMTDDGFGDTVPIRPGVGAYQLLFSYDLPLKRSLEFIKPITMPVNAIVILVPEEGITIKGDSIQDGGIREVQGAAYRLYNGTGVTPGNDLRMTITRASSFLSSTKNANLLVGLSALGVVLIVSGFWLYRKNINSGKASLTSEPAGSSDAPFESSRGGDGCDTGC